MSRPHNPGSPSRGSQQTNPHTREAYKKPGKHPTTLSLRAEARGLFLQVCRDPATQVRTRMGSANNPLTALSLRAEARGLLLHSRQGQATQARTHRFRKKQQKGRRARYGPGVRRLDHRGFRQPPQDNRVRDNYGRARTWPWLEQAIAWDALSRVRDQRGVLRMGSHRREAPRPRGQSNGLGTQ